MLGVETECRIGKAVFPAHYEVGWHITGTAGVFGAAAAAGKLLGLDAQRMTWALGLSGDAADRLARNVRDHDEELPSRTGGAKRVDRRIAGRAWLYQFGDGH